MVILATKLYGGDQRAARQSLDAILDDQLGGLSVDTEVGVRRDGFVSVTLEGADAVAARNLLDEAWGTIPGRLEPGETYRGVLEGWTDDGFVVDVGEEVVLPAEHLGLGPGTPEQVATRFGLVSKLPVSIVYGDPSMPSETERDRLFEWRRGPGRVTANGTTRGQLRATINRAGHADDIHTIERLGLLEQSIVCDEDTDPPGLLAAIGPYVSGDLACVIP